MAARKKKMPGPVARQKKKKKKHRTDRKKEGTTWPPNSKSRDVGKLAKEGKRGTAGREKKKGNEIKNRASKVGPERKKEWAAGKGGDRSWIQSVEKKEIKVATGWVGLLPTIGGKKGSGLCGRRKGEKEQSSTSHSYAKGRPCRKI